MTLSDFLKKIELNPKIAELQSDSCFWFKIYTDLSPEDYLHFAKEDIKSGEIKNSINAVANAKRAIDCQIDNFLINIGYDYRKISSYPCVNSFIKDSKSRSLKFKILETFEIVPLNLLSKVRELRNKVEHEYFQPTQDDVVMAVELAELFIGCLQQRLFSDLFYIFNDFQDQTANALCFSWHDSGSELTSTKFWKVYYGKLSGQFDFLKNKEIDPLILKTNSDLYLYICKLSFIVDSKQEVVGKYLMNLLEIIDNLDFVVQ